MTAPVCRGYGGAPVAASRATPFPDRTSGCFLETWPIESAHPGGEEGWRDVTEDAPQMLKEIFFRARKFEIKLSIMQAMASGRW